MHPEVGVSVGLRPMRCFREPGARHHDARRGDPVVLQGLLDSAVDGMRHTEVIGMNHQQAGVRGVTKTFGNRARGGIWTVLGKGKTANEDRKNRGYKKPMSLVHFSFLTCWKPGATSFVNA